MATRSLAKMTALVPVPEGSIKAKEQAKVAVIISSRGMVRRLVPNSFMATRAMRLCRHCSSIAFARKKPASNIST